MKKSKAIIAFFIAISIIATSYSMAFAESGIPNGMGGNTAISADPEVQIAEAKNLTEAQQAQLREKLSQSTLTPEQLPSSRYSGWYYLNSRLVTYPQEADNFCGIACAQAAIEYLTGRYYDQDDISIDVRVESWGTTLTNLKIWLNNMQSKNTYTLKDYQTTMGNMQATLYVGIHNYDAPPIACIVVNSTVGSTWPALTNGHAVIIRGITGDYDYCAISDPGYIYFESGTDQSFLDGRYVVSASDLHTAITKQTKCGYIY